MDHGLRDAIDGAITRINVFSDNRLDINVRADALVYFHIIQAKQALMRALLIKDPFNFQAHKLVKEYEGILKRIAERH